MIEALRSKNEKQRLVSLAKLHLLDTPIEERFERITRIACRILDVPITSFTLVDETRQWFKSIQGLNIVETPRRVSLCAHTILNDDVMLIPDVQQDERFYDNPLVTAYPYICFYAGCPIRAPDGEKVGTLC